MKFDIIVSINHYIYTTGNVETMKGISYILDKMTIQLIELCIQVKIMVMIMIQYA